MTVTTSKLARFRTIPALLRIIIFVLAAIATILAGAAMPIANSSDFYADGLRPAMIIMVTPAVSLRERN